MQLLTDWFHLVTAAFVIAVACAAVATRRLFRAAIYLMLLLVGIAAVYLVLGFEFLAGVQLMVYVGGIVVLLVFAVMLTSSVEIQEDVPSGGRRIVAAIITALFFTVTIGVLRRIQFPEVPGRVESDAASIGRVLLDTGAGGYVLSFELISLLLLASVIGAMVVARRSPAADSNDSAAQAAEGTQ